MTLANFEQDLKNVLKNLYNPAYHPSEMVRRTVGIRPEQGTEALQVAITQAIEHLRPTENVPATAPSWRLYQVLLYRYIRGFTQKKTAQILGITERYVRYEQQQAIQVLAQWLWEQNETPPIGKGHPARDTLPPPKQAAKNNQTTAWRSQVVNELTLLQQDNPGVVTDVSRAIRKAIEFAQPLASRHGVDLLAKRIGQELIVPLHPTLVREILTTAIAKLARQMTSGEITVEAVQAGESVQLTITGYPVKADTTPHSQFILEVLKTQDSTVNVHVDDDCVEFIIMLPAARRVTVAVVENNPDLVNFYRHYTTRTQYEIVHVDEEQRIFETILEIAPDIIVLDILLSEIDGWDLLAQLQKHPATKMIPVIVCSVIRHQDLALLAGASLYLQKPVTRQTFIEALDQVFSQGVSKQ